MVARDTTSGEGVVMSKGTRLTWVAWSLVFVACAVVFGLWTKEIPVADCGSVFVPSTTAETPTSGGVECQGALDRRAMVVRVLLVLGAGFALTASVGGALFPPRPPRYRDTRVG
jgi:hypothetical protein